MIRAASKNHASVDGRRRSSRLRSHPGTMRANGGATTTDCAASWHRRPCATTAAYDAAISNWLGSVVDHEGRQPGRAKDSREPYGAIPQGASRCAMARIRTSRRHSSWRETSIQACISSARAASGQGAVLQQHRRYGCCARMRQGVSRSPSLRHRQACQSVRRRRGRFAVSGAYERAFSTDPESAFGGIIAFNRDS